VADQAVVDLEEALKDAETTIEKAKPLIPNKCFYINSLGKDGSGSNLYLQVAKEDKYAPKKTGAYNVDLREKSEASRKQQ